MSKAKIIIGDVRTAMKLIPDQSVQTCITSPPYWGLRDYGQGDQIGLEETPQQYVDQMVEIFREVWRVLKDDGTLWLNIGDSYSGSGKGPAGNLGATHNERHMEGKHSAIVPDGLKPKDLIGIPWRLAFALQADGWYLRQDIIWAKPNPMPESVTDRCTKSHEYVFLMSKSRQYFYDHLAIKEDATTEPKARDKNAEGYQADYAKGERFSAGERVFGADGKRNKRDVWTIATKPFKGAHFAVMPEALVEPCILAGSSEGDTVLDPFTGSGTVGMVALRHNRYFVGTELNPDYAELAVDRIYNDAPLLNEIEKELANG
jgi:DNA modification methylase